MYETDSPAALAALAVPFVPAALPPTPHELLLMLVFVLLLASAPPLPASTLVISTQSKHTQMYSQL